MPIDAFAFLAAFWPKKRIMHFYQAGKAVLGIPIRYRLSNFMGYQPCRLVISDFQGTLHLRYRHSDFIHAHVVDQPLLLYQRRTGFMKFCPCSQTDFCSTKLEIQNNSHVCETVT
jgi:hypothetical protein